MNDNDNAWKCIFHSITKKKLRWWKNDDDGHDDDDDNDFDDDYDNVETSMV